MVGKLDKLAKVDKVVKLDKVDLVDKQSPEKRLLDELPA